MLPPFLASSSESKIVGWIWHWQLSMWLREKIQSITQYYISTGCRITAAGNFSSRAFYTFEVAALARMWNSSSTFSRILANPEYHTICFFFITESNGKHTELPFFFFCIYVYLVAAHLIKNNFKYMGCSWAKECFKRHDCSQNNNFILYPNKPYLNIVWQTFLQKMLSKL